MSWQTDNGGHEGWAPAVWEDGWVRVASCGAGAIAAPVGSDGRIDYDAPTETRDGWTAIGWRGYCECGWRGQLWERVADRGEHDFKARRIYDGDPVYFDGTHIEVQRYGDAPGEVEEAISAEWEQHVRPKAALEKVRETAAAVAAEQARLDTAVREARAEGNSWAEIGKAVGMTRQAAHERWSGRS